MTSRTQPGPTLAGRLHKERPRRRRAKHDDPRTRRLRRIRIRRLALRSLPKSSPCGRRRTIFLYVTFKGAQRGVLALDQDGGFRWQLNESQYGNGVFSDNRIFGDSMLLCAAGHNLPIGDRILRFKHLQLSASQTIQLFTCDVPVEPVLPAAVLARQSCLDVMCITYYSAGLIDHGRRRK